MNIRSKQRRPQFRIAVNSRCGRSCFYCRPSGETVAHGVSELNIKDLLPVASHLRARGISSAKITGGDPALYGQLEELVHELKHGLMFEHIEVISRHPAIGTKATGLIAAGLDQINFSLDSVDPVTYAKITGQTDLDRLEQAIRVFVQTGIPVKINTVFMQGINDSEFVQIIRHCENLGVSTLKFLDVIVDMDQGMPSFSKRLAKIVPGGTLQWLYGDMSMLRAWLADCSDGCEIGTQGDLGHPMEVYRLPSGMRVVLKDSHAGAWYGDICANCSHFPCHDALMALRLGPDGNLQCCLLNSEAVVRLDDVRGDSEAIAERIDLALSTYETAVFAESATYSVGGLKNA
ncbi:MAG: hypothetical protein COC12_09920 [Rhodobacteraceae bacterium]|nr:MAG: hypothetical protein COC12_09920 [Paracoccaceae bacterium]